MSAPSLTAIRSVIGQDLTPEVIVSASRHAKTLIPRIQVAMEKEWERFISYPSLRSGELRPFISFDQYNFVGGSNYTQGRLDDLHMPLFYAHRVAFPDPLLAQQDGTNDFDLGAVLNAYGILAPLVDAKIMVLVNVFSNRTSGQLEYEANIERHSRLGS